MSTTNPHQHQEESTGAPTAPQPRWGSRLRRRWVPVASVAALFGLALATAGWIAATASAESESPPAATAVRNDDHAGTNSDSTQSESPPPVDNGDDTTYEQCVAAALEALGPPSEAFSEGSGGSVGTAPEAPGDGQTTPAKPGGPEPAPEPLDIEEPHPNSPAHEWCTADCPEDEQCARPREFIIARDDDVETTSIENTEPEGDPAD